MMTKIDPWMVLYNPKTHKMDICLLCNIPNIELINETVSIAHFGRPTILPGHRRLAPIEFKTYESLFEFFNSGIDHTGLVQTQIMLWLPWCVFMLDGYFSAYEHSLGPSLLGSKIPMTSTFTVNAFKML